MGKIFRAPIILQSFLLLLGTVYTIEIQHQEQEYTERYVREHSQQYMKQIMTVTPHSKNEPNKSCLKNNVWYIWDNQTKSCKCGDDLNGVVQCNSNTDILLVLDCNCLTFDQGTTLPVVGHCLYNCVNYTNNRIYHSAPTDCGSMNRQGTLCGQCLDGYAMPAYSYSFKCIRCDSEKENWGLYIVFAFLPLTVFIIITLVFRINVLSPKLNMFVFAVQYTTTPALVTIFLQYLSQRPKITKILSEIVIILCAIWNLDFIRINVLPDICINAPSLHILILDYLIAIYPMLLMALAYIVVELHGSGFKPLLIAWKPFHRFFAQFRRQWGIQTSIMDAFVTFFFLSTTKLLWVSLGLLTFTLIHKPDGEIHSVILYHDPTIKYFGKEHLPYALMAITILTVFIAFPSSLLLCYQCKAYRKCLTKCQIRGSTMDEFVDTFQKYYKDGSNGTWDCRWFSGFFILIRFLAYLLYAASLSGTFYFLATVLFLIAAIVVVVVEPYNEEYSVFNIICASLFLWYAMFSTSIAYEGISIPLEAQLSQHYIMTILTGLVPLVYIIIVAVNHFVRFSGRKRLTSSLPDRLLHSSLYQDTCGYRAIPHS